MKRTARYGLALLWVVAMVGCAQESEYSAPGADDANNQVPTDEPSDGQEPDDGEDEPGDPGPTDPPPPDDGPDEPDEPVEEVMLNPTARASSDVLGQSEAQELQVVPLETVIFDPGTGAENLSFVWSVIVRPEGSTADFTPSNTARTPSLFMDLAGNYEVLLEVFDQNNRPAGTEKIQIEVIPDELIHVQLVWDTDGTDLDLHFMHPTGRWNQSPFDCYWANVEPNWFDPENNDDNPSLDIDDVDGFGPENINLDIAEADTPYEVGVHFYSDRAQMGSTEATVRIFLSGELAFEQSMTLSHGQFWHVASIEIDAQEPLVSAGELTDGFP